MNREEAERFLYESLNEITLLYFEKINPDHFQGMNKDEYLSICASLFTLFSLDVLKFIASISKISVGFLFNEHVIIMKEEIKRDSN